MGISPVASMGSTTRTLSSASSLAGSLFKYALACTRSQGSAVVVLKTRRLWNHSAAATQVRSAEGNFLGGSDSAAHAACMSRFREQKASTRACTVSILSWRGPRKGGTREGTQKDGGDSHLQSFLVSDEADVEGLSGGQHRGSRLQQHQPRPQDWHHLQVSIHSRECSVGFQVASRKRTTVAGWL